MGGATTLDVVDDQIVFHISDFSLDGEKFIDWEHGAQGCGIPGIMTTHFIVVVLI
ncbi:hypothetical protein D3C73_1138190 [compost metagenome]